MDAEELRQALYSRVDELPTLPAVVPRLLSLMERPETGAADVTEAVSGDQALTSKLLKAANSAYYGFSREIVSVEHAVALLGFRMVKSLALSIGVMRSFEIGADVPGYSHEGMWIHSLAVATALQELSRRSGRGEVEHHFVLGLLHDIGKVVLVHFFAELFSQAIQAAKDGESDYIAAERAVFGCDHGEVGALLLSRWRFPKEICNPIAAHHGSEMPDGTDALDVATLCVADALPKSIALGGAGFPAPSDDLAANLETIGLGEDDFEEMKDFLRGREDEIRAFSAAVG